MAITKKPNLIVRYFTPFGFKQIADVLMVLASVLVIIGLSIGNQTVTTTALVSYILASAVAILMCLKVMFSGINKRAPAYKSAFANIIIMLVILAVAILALVWSMQSFYA